MFSCTDMSVVTNFFHINHWECQYDRVHITTVLFVTHNTHANLLAATSLSLIMISHINGQCIIYLICKVPFS